MIKISKIFGDFVPRDSSLCQGLLPSIRHFENRRGEGPGDEVDQLAGFFNGNHTATKVTNHGSVLSTLLFLDQSEKSPDSGLATDK